MGEYRYGVRSRAGGETVRTSGKLMRILQRQPDGSVRAIRIHVAGAHRVFYLATRAEAIYVLHAFEKKTQKTSAQDLRIGRDRFRALGKLRQQHGKEKRG
jgi:phage-related protein